MTGGRQHLWVSGQPYDRNLAIGLLLVAAIAGRDRWDVVERLSALLPLPGLPANDEPLSAAAVSCVTVHIVNAVVNQPDGGST